MEYLRVPERVAGKEYFHKIAIYISGGMLFASIGKTYPAEAVCSLTTAAATWVVTGRRFFDTWYKVAELP